MTEGMAKRLGLSKYIFGDGYCNEILEVGKDGYVKWYDRDKDCIIEGHVSEYDGDQIFVTDGKGYTKCFPVEV